MSKDIKKVPQLRFPGFEGEWESEKIGNLGNTYTGLSGKTKEDFGKGSAKFVTYMNVFSNSFADLAMNEKIEIDEKQNTVKYGDVFFTVSSETPNEVGMSSVWLGNEENVYLNSFCFGFRLKKKVDLYYLGYLLRSPSIRSKLIFLAQGISRYNISKTKVLEISVLLPNLQEQQKIGAFFRQLDDLIKFQEHNLKHLKLQKQALLQKMFPQNGSNIPEIRFSEFSEEWENTCLGELGEVMTGNTPKIAEKDNWSPANSKFIWITPTDIKGLTSSDSERYLSLKGWEKARTVPKDSILITSIASIGKNTINTVPVAFNQQINAIIPSDNDAYFILTAMIKNEERFSSIAGKSATAIINKTEFKKFKIMIPTDLKEQRRVGEFFQQLDTLITLHERKLKHLELQKKALLQQLFV